MDIIAKLSQASSTSWAEFVSSLTNPPTNPPGNNLNTGCNSANGS